MRRITAVLVLVSLVGLAPVGPAGGQEAPEGATVTVVSTEAEYLAALDELSADGSATHVIQLGADIQVHEASDDPIYDGTTPLILDGAGHELSGELGVTLLQNRSGETLTVVDTTFRDSSSAITSGGSVVIRRSRFIDNRLHIPQGCHMGGVYAYITDGHRPSIQVSDSLFLRNAGWGCSFPSALNSAGSISVDRTTFRGNLATMSALMFSSQGTRINRSTIVRNTTRASILMSTHSGVLRLVNSTVVGNHAQHVGSSGTGLIQADEIDLRYATIVGNTDDPRAPGPVLRADVLRSRSSVIAHHVAACRRPGQVDSSASVSTDRSCRLTGPSGGVIADPRLAPLADNGGPTLTRRPQADSPLVDAVAHCLPNIRIDQRGRPRPAPSGCDIGAVERP